MCRQNYKLLTSITVFFAGLVILMAFFIVKQVNQKNLQKINTKDVLKTAEKTDRSPTPFPFQELTIPYLTNREYKSKLQAIEEISQGSNYTSYLTSYLSDEFIINSLLNVPNREKPKTGWPAVIFIHGYIPPENYRTQEKYLTYVDNLSKNGLVVLKIDLRGHGDSEGEATGAYYSGDYIIDTLNAYSALENYDLVDKDKIYLWGHSMAGNVVLRSMAANSKIKKGVIWAGAVYTYEDFGEFRISDNSYIPPENESERRKKRDQLFDMYGTFSSDSWFWIQVPATNYLEQINGEIQLHHAVNDQTVDIGYSKNLDEILTRANIKHEFFEYASGGHNIDGRSFTEAMDRSVKFFLK